MKEYFYEKDNKAYIIDDEKGIIIEDAKDNTEEILIAQNNIELIKEKIDVLNKDKLEEIYIGKSIIKKSIIQPILTSILFAVCLGSGYITAKINLSQLFLLSSLGALVVGYTGSGIFRNKERKNSINAYEVYINELEKELEKEKTRYKTLKNKSKDKIVDSTIIKEIPNSEVIDKLNQKKDLIVEYFKNRKKYISVYKNNEIYTMLRKNGYSESDIEFIKFLIEEDLKNTNTNTNEKAKTKKYTNN